MGESLALTAGTVATIVFALSTLTLQRPVAAVRGSDASLGAPNKLGDHV